MKDYYPVKRPRLEGRYTWKLAVRAWMVAGGHWLRGIIQRVGDNTIKQHDALHRYPEDVANENGTSSLPQRNSGRTNHPCHANGREPRADATSDRSAFLLLPAGIHIYLWQRDGAGGIIIYRLKRIYRPEFYQGRNLSGDLRRRNYFEGWYFKVAFREGAFAFIPGLSLAGENPHSFIQVIDGVHNRSFYYSFPPDAFRYDKGRFGISIDNNQFSLDRVHLNLDDFAVDLSIKNPIRWPSSPWSPNSMGWYGYIRFMECYHGNIILDAQVDGLVNGQSFSNGHFYLEKDWGRSFPQAWIWMQSNNFTQPASFCCSIARVPFRGRVFTGFIVGLWTGGSLYRFATYTGAKIEHIGFGQSSVEIVIRQGRRRLELQALRQPGAVLASPVEGVMTGRVEETLQAKIEVRLTDRETTILEDVGQWAGLEVVRPEYLDIAEQ